MLWGSASADAVFLEPAFLIDAVGRRASGARAVPAGGTRAPGGELRFAFGFTPNPVDHGGAHFLFNVPYDPERDGALGERCSIGSRRRVHAGSVEHPPDGDHPGSPHRSGSGRSGAIGRVGGARPGGDIEIMVSDGPARRRALSVGTV